MNSEKETKRLLPPIDSRTKEIINIDVVKKGVDDETRIIWHVAGCVAKEGGGLKVALESKDKSLKKLISEDKFYEEYTLWHTS